MARRYSKIKQGAEYKKGLDAYTDYLKNADTRPTKRLQGGTRGARRELLRRAVIPFGMSVTAGQVYQVSASKKSSDAIGSAVSANRLIEPGNSADIVVNRKFKPARVSAFKGNGAANYVRSKVTQLFYLKYEGDSYSLPFGAINETEEEATGAKVVKAAIIGVFGAADIQHISFSPERVPV